MPDPCISIRSETLPDYAAIADIHVRAFGAEGVENIVLFHRQRPAFEPRLSMVAERDGVIVGHILYSPRVFRLMDQDVLGLNMSPLGVHPMWHKQGVGSALMEAGDAEARRLGYAFVSILGHDTYYPRFGYQTHAYGASWLTVPARTLPVDAPLETRRVLPEDVPALASLWQAEESCIDLAIVPDSTLVVWHSPDRRIACTVYLSGGKIIGYTRISTSDPTRVTMFLAADGASALRVAAHLTQTHDIHLPVHPRSGSAEAFAPLGTPDLKAWSAGMARGLMPSPYDEYRARVQRGERPVGRTIWPAEFDV